MGHLMYAICVTMTWLQAHGSVSVYVSAVESIHICSEVAAITATVPCAAVAMI